jgi:hypothetical protein
MAVSNWNNSNNHPSYTHMKHLVYLTTPLALLAGNLHAQQNSPAEAQTVQQTTPVQSEKQEKEDVIIVRTTPTSQTIGTQVINSEQIKNQPTGNGSVTELLRNNPNVQFANGANASTTPGELAPENVSFHGEKFYQNNYMIDGLSNNNNINPGADKGGLPTDPDGFRPTDLPAGGAQSFWINSELIEELQVFDSNISAKYGDFTGGVVDARLKDPSVERFSGRVMYRTTSDAWTKYHIDSKSLDKFNSATEVNIQPRFKKNFYTASFNLPLSEQAAILIAYNRQESEIPFYHQYLNEWDDQQRINETLLIKGIYHLSGGDIIRATGMVAPHESKYFKKNIKNGAYTNTGGGYRGNIEWEHNADWGKVSSLVGYQHDENKIDHQSDVYQTWYRYFLPRGLTQSNTITWGSGVPGANGQTGLIGGYGSYETSKNTLTAKQSYEFNPIDLGFAGVHQIDAGWSVDQYTSQYQRSRDAYTGFAVAHATNNATNTIDTSTVCIAGDIWCIPGEQWMRSRILYKAREVSASYLNYAAYVQDSIKFGRLETTFGVRASFDDYLRNLNVAPRFSASYDVFNDRTTRVLVGANRYYAQNMLAYKLRNRISESTTQTRASSTAAWVDGATRLATYDYDVSGLKTPYSDELALGLSQRVMDTVWTLKWVNRKGRDQFGRTSYTDANGQRYYILDNRATTEGNTYSLQVEPISPFKLGSASVKWSFGANVVRNKSSSQVYYDDSNSDDTKVIIDDQLMEKGDMKALDFNLPWMMYANVDTALPAWNLNWGQRFGYTSGYTGYNTSFVQCPTEHAACGTETVRATLYTPKKYKPAFTYDWRVSYKKPVALNQNVEVTLDVLNVFDRVVETSSTTTGETITYKTGRQFWLSMAYNW